MDKSALCCFLDNGFDYRARNWYTGETWNVSLSEQTEYQEKLKMEEEKKSVGALSSGKKGTKKMYIDLVIIV